LTPVVPGSHDRDDDGHELERLASFFRRTLRAWPVTLLLLSLAAFACCAFLYLRHPNYRSETVILYSQGVRQTEPGEQDDNPRNESVRLKELLMSRPKLAGVVTRFGLYPTTRSQYGMSDAVEELKRHIEFRAPGGDTFSIAFTGSAPSEAERVTQALGELVIAGDAELRKTQAEQARDFLTTERASKGAELREAEQRLAEFMGKHRRFALDTTPLAAGAAIRASMAPAGPVYVTRAPRSASAPAPATTGAAASTPSASGAPDAGERARALAALAAARANLAEQLEHYTPAHPDVRAAQSEVDRAMARVAALGPEPRPSAAPAAAPSTATTATTAPATNAPVHHVSLAAIPAPRPPEPGEDVVGLETEWLKLTRDVTAARQRVDQVEAALFKADVVASSERAGRAVQITVIDPAFLPERPVGLGLTLILALFLGAGLVAGLLAAALVAAFDDRIYRATDARGTTAILVEVPRFSSRRRAYATE
jgi:uncharacterized protein involved in exopolysaccharide biosynthesis